MDAKRHNAALQPPGDNCISGKLSMRDTLIPVRCKRLLGCAGGTDALSLTLLRRHQVAQELLSYCND
jgi:hypothetical protein